MFFAKHNGVIHQQWLCSNGHQITLSTVSDRRRCYALEDQQEIGFWKWTWLERSRLKYMVVVLFIYCWSKNLITIKFCHTTAVDWKEISSWKLRLVAFTDFKNCRRPRFARQIYDTLTSRQKNIHRASSSSTVDFRGICWETKGAQIRHAPISSSSVKRALRFKILFFTLFEWAGLTFWRVLNGNDPSILQ